MSPELIARMEQLRQQRHAEVKALMDDIDRANDRLSRALADAREQRLKLASSKARLATLIAHGDAKAVHNNQLLTVNIDGGVRIEPVLVLGLL